MFSSPVAARYVKLMPTEWHGDYSASFRSGLLVLDPKSEAGIAWAAMNEKERLAAVKAEEERVAAEAKRIEDERIAEEERVAAEIAALAAAAEKAEADAEAERIAEEKRIEDEKIAEKARIAKEAAETKADLQQGIRQVVGGLNKVNKAIGKIPI